MKNAIQELKRLGFRNHKGHKREFAITLEPATNNYITLIVSINSENWEFMNIEIEGAVASDIVKSSFKKFSREEIINFLNENP